MSCIPKGNIKCRHVCLCYNFPFSCEECQEKRTLFNRYPNVCYALTPLQKMQRKQYLDSLKVIVDSIRGRYAKKGDKRVKVSKELYEALMNFPKGTKVRITIEKRGD